MVRRLLAALMLILLMVPSALGDLDSVKRAIKDKGAKWEAGETSVSRMTEPELRRMLGGHAVCVVGWSHRGHHFVCKNSWGTGWGEDGYFDIAFSQMNVDCPVQFGTQAGSFKMGIGAPARHETVVSAWGLMKNGSQK